MPRNLVTGFKKIATAGPTADGREIKEQDLLDIAETYDEKDQYAAVIWPDHLRWFSLGIVKEVKAEKDSKGRTSLYARLAPNDHALEYNKRSQMLFTSIEISPNFAKSGKAYLTGLAFTDSPASLGTQELRFSSIKNSETSFFSTPEPLEDINDNNKISKLIEDDQAAMDGFFSKLKALFSSLPDQSENPNSPPVPEEQEPDAMNEEQFNQLLGALNAQTEAFNTLAAKVGGETEEETPPEQTPPAESKGVSDEKFNKLLEAVTKQGESMAKLGEQFAALQEEQPGTPVPQGDGAAEGKKLI